MAKRPLDDDVVGLFSDADVRPKSDRRQRVFSVTALILLVVTAVATLALIRLSYRYYDGASDRHQTTTADPRFPVGGDAIYDYWDNGVSNRVIGESQCAAVEDKDKFDCNPDEPISADVCLARGCCWSPTVVSPANERRNRSLPYAPLGVPYCYYGPNYVGYSVESIDIEVNRFLVALKRQIRSGFPDDALFVKLEIVLLNDYTVRLKFYDPNVMRYEPPIPRLNISQQRQSEHQLYYVEVSRDGHLRIVRRATWLPVFEANLSRLTFSAQYLQLSARLPSDYVYGIGEHKDGFRKRADWKRYTLFNRDQYPIENFNLYGSHAFHLAVEDDAGHSSGVFLFNSNAMDILLQPTPAITYRTIGGLLDFFVFLGPKPADVVRQYQELIGRPALPPYWALGFHLCRFGYRSLDNLRATVERNRAAKIPYDVQWTDIDAMSADKDFSYDDKAFAGLPEFVDDLHKVGMKYVPMFDPGISSGETPGTYPPYDEGVEMDIFVKNSSGQIFEGKVWNKKSTVWPDFTNPRTVEYWTRQFARYHESVAFDGAWIDMNEPSNFYDGQINGCPANSSLENPQYVPGAGNSGPLRTHTICMTARQYAGLHYDVHNLYGISEGIATNIALKTVLKRRPLIISRSTFAGHGRYASHWDGDILATWESMRWSIASILNFNMFGIPLVGADICGFNGNTTVELCARWSELGAFYPFARNHNSDDCVDQDPAALGPTVVAAARDALENRYALLPYLYTLFVRAHLFGETVARPLFFEFPADAKARKIDTQFLWGSALMIVPTLAENATSVNAYIPAGKWYVSKTSRPIVSRGEYVELDSPLTTINVLLRGGSIISPQLPNVTTEQSRLNDFVLGVALDESGRASGQLYWDSGDGLYNLVLGEYNVFEFSAANNTVKSTPVFYGYPMANRLTTAFVLGVSRGPTAVTVNNATHSAFEYDAEIHALVVDSIGLLMAEKIVIAWT